MRFVLIGCLGAILTAAATGVAATTTNQAPVQFKGLGAYIFSAPPAPAISRSSAGAAWVTARPASGDTNIVLFGSQLVVQTATNLADGAARALSSLPLARQVTANTFIFEAPDAAIAVVEAARLSLAADILAAYPVVAKHIEPHSQYAPRPSDSWFFEQWPLENRQTNGAILGADINAREAWPISTGAGVTIAIADTGVEMAHPELAAKLAGSPNYNFDQQTNWAGPMSGSALGAHGTEVAGLAAAGLDNYRMAGVAPDARLASWLIFRSNYLATTDTRLMEMYQYGSNTVAVQNHSWGHVGLKQNAATPLELIGISNAVNHGRSGLGVVMVRSAGNDRATGGNANDDMYANDPRVIAVAAVRGDGRAASYSEPGACLLVAAPSGDPSADYRGLFTTDLLGNLGANQLNYFPPNEDLSDYVFYSMGFSGTSAATPLVSGIAALVIAANPGLTARDTREIIPASARHYDFADPSLATNGAGFVFSHNTGFGVPDAAEAVRLARNWPTRRPAVRASWSWTGTSAIPDAGLRVLITGDAVPAWLGSISNLPSNGPHPDAPTRVLPLVYAGYGTNYAGMSMTNRAALIQRGGGPFANSINLSAAAGAEFAIVFNFATNTSPDTAPGGDQLLPMGSTDYTPIPAVFIGHSAGSALTNLLATNALVQAQLRLDSTNTSWTVSKTMFLHQAGLRVQTDHPLRGDVRITLVSPAGSRSVLQRYNGDVSPGPVDWTYWSRLPLGESSAGVWTACVADEADGAQGNVTGLELILEGEEIIDTDADGLDDDWERAHFGGRGRGPKDDPDLDGAINAREWLTGGNPAVAENIPPILDLSRWQGDVWRLSWPGSPDYNYEVFHGDDPAHLEPAGVIPGRFPVTEWLEPAPTNRYYRVKLTPK